MELVGFELLLPALVRRAQQAGIPVPPHLNAYDRQREEKLRLLPPAALYSPTTTVAHSLEFLGDQANVAALHATQAANGAIGNPAGGQSFSVWQPGYLLYQLSGGNLADTGASDSAPVKGDVGWSPTIMPLSPDGRYFDTYVAYSFDTFDSLTPPSTQHVSPSEATLAPHDKALLALAQQMTQATGDLTQQPGYAIAWRPDGKRMAAVGLNANVANTATPPSALTVTVYDTASGQVVKRFTPDWTGLSTRDASLEMAQWSPDGKRLLLEDNVYGAITIWGPGALPA